MTKPNTITFNGKLYIDTKAGIATVYAVNLTALDTMSMSGLVELYNLVSSNLGRGRVKRFADSKKGVKRTWALLQEWDAQDDSGSGLDVSSFDSPQQPKAQLSPADQKQIKDEAADRKAPLSEQLIQVAAATRKAPAAGRGNIWRRPKHEEPARTAYRPRPGSIQRTMYDALTQEGGITMEDFCDVVRNSGSRDSMMWNPSGVWGGLRYLFVTLRGYGLDFDGKRLQLLVPKDERDVPAKGEAKKA